MFFCSRVCLAAFVIGIVVFIGVDVRHQPKRLISLAGILVFLFGGQIASKAPARVSKFRILNIEVTHK